MRSLKRARFAEENHGLQSNSYIIFFCIFVSRFISTRAQQETGCFCRRCCCCCCCSFSVFFVLVLMMPFFVFSLFRKNWIWLHPTGRQCWLCRRKRNGKSTATGKRWDQRKRGERRREGGENDDAAFFMLRRRRRRRRRSSGLFSIWTFFHALAIFRKLHSVLPGCVWRSSRFTPSPFLQFIFIPSNRKKRRGQNTIEKKREREKKKLFHLFTEARLQHCFHCW